MAFGPDGRLLATASLDGARVELLEVEGGREAVRVDHGRGVNALAFSPDGRLLATASMGGTAWLLEVEGGRQVAPLDHGSPVNAVAFSPDGKLLATAGGDGHPPCGRYLATASSCANY